MKACAFVFLFVFCYAECRKTYAPIDKNANLAFINMEGGGVKLAPPPSANLPVQPNAPAPNTPANSPPGSPTKPALPLPPTQKPTAASVTQAPAPKPAPASPVTKPILISPKPVNPAPVVNPITTPGPGSVKQLVNFYDSQGKASPIRPYSYSQAVKQG